MAQEIKSNREANWVIVYRDEKLGNDYFVHTLLSDSNFTPTGNIQDAARMDWGVAKVMAEVLKRNTGYNIFITLL